MLNREEINLIVNKFFNVLNKKVNITTFLFSIRYIIFNNCNKCQIKFNNSFHFKYN